MCSIITEKKFVVPKELEGIRLDLFFKESSSDISRRVWRERIIGGGVYVNKQRVRQLSYTLKANDVVRYVEDSFTNYKGRKLDKKDIIFINENNIVAINKPDGMPSLPTPGQVINSAQYHLQNILREMKIKFHFLSSVHRLDAPVSGVLIFALNTKTLQILSRSFRVCSVKKKYIAICSQKPPFAEGIVDAGILIPKGMDINSPVRIDLKRGLKSITKWRILSFNSNYNLSLVEFLPLTGRRHQIRVHAMYEGFPILGDTRYGCQSPFPPHLKERLYLHAYSYYIPQFDLEITSPLPSAFVIHFPDVK